MASQMPNWNEVLKEVGALQHQGNAAHDIVRRKYLQGLHKATSRHVIAYYSGFLSKRNAPELDINDEDKNGFMATLHKLNRKLGLDLILHTPGGDIAATQSIVDYLHKMFGNDIRAIVPQIAMSAGTMIACTCKEILMAKHSNLGPIDPHMGGTPVAAVKLEFNRAIREVAKYPQRIPIWQSIIGQYKPTFLSQCDNAVKWSNQFVFEQLRGVMFAGDTQATKKARNAVRKLSDYRQNKRHNRHIHYDECKEIGLNVKLLEDEPDDLRDAVLSVHHCYMHTMMNTPAVKIIENHLGAAFVKLAPQMVMVKN